MWKHDLNSLLRRNLECENEPKIHNSITFIGLTNCCAIKVAVHSLCGVNTEKKLLEVPGNRDVAGQSVNLDDHIISIGQNRRVVHH